MNIKEYIRELNTQYQTGNAREHSYRPALKELLASLLPGMIVTNEPARIDCGAPDYIITHRQNGLPVFFVEAKDIADSDLDGRRQHKEQFNRYKQALDHIIFTDYLDFHLYEQGVFVDSVRIAEIKGDRIAGITGAENKFLSMIQHLGVSGIQRITSASHLAKLMAGKARLLANIIGQAVVSDEEKENHANEEASGLFQIPPEAISQAGLHEQMETFRRVLLHDITPHSFADVYAQTIVYGLFAARLNDKTPEDFSRYEALSLIPKTSPFLRNLFQQIAGLDLDSRIEWIIDDLVTAFGATDMQKILKGYHEDTQRTDPMMHFYEDFLAAYDPSLRKAKGVWYTPQPVVKFIVRAVDEILQKDFGLKMGLADYSKVSHTVSVEQSSDKRTSDKKKHVSKDLFRVQILDPAMGTGTFISEIIKQVKQKFVGNEGMWNSYLRSYLLPRIFGFEVMVAPYTIAHMKIFLQLKEYSDLSDKDLPVMNLLLTNSLEEADEATGSLFAYWLSQEANRANIIKRDTPVMVMIGNPPYSVSSQNKGEWINNLIEDYKKDLNERNIQPLSDDYIKFIRLGQHYIEKNGEGILAFITNNSFIDGIIHRQMRRKLLDTFDDIYIVDLHGNAKKKETAPDGSKDENVFDIQQGVSINIFVKTGRKQKDQLANVHHRDLFGSRNYKYEVLNALDINTDEWTKIDCTEPYYFFVPKDFTGEETYNLGFKINELFSINTLGITTSKDNFVICDTPQVVEERISHLITWDIERLRATYNLSDSRDWSIQRAKDDVGNIFLKEKVTSISYRPFETKFLYYTGKTNGIVARPRYHSLRHMLNHWNLAICVIRVNRDAMFKVFITNTIVDKTYLSSKDNASFFPLYNVGSADSIFEEKSELVPNFNPEIIAKIEAGLGEKVEPLELFDYIYAVLHSPRYRETYKEFLKIDFPRIPYPNDYTLYINMAAKGKELRQLHLMEDSQSWPVATQFPMPGSGEVNKLEYKDGCVHINENQYFSNIPESAWNFYIGGYQPTQKWLKDRKGSRLSFEDIRHYQEIIHALTLTERIMREIDDTLYN